MDFFLTALGVLIWLIIVVAVGLISTFIYFCVQYVIQTKKEKRATKIIKVNFNKRRDSFESRK